MTVAPGVVRAAVTQVACGVIQQVQYRHMWQEGTRVCLFSKFVGNVTAIRHSPCQLPQARVATCNFDVRSGVPPMDATPFSRQIIASVQTQFLQQVAGGSQEHQHQVVAG
jgi:hypothetical protein